MTFETPHLKIAMESDMGRINKMTEIRVRAPGYGTPGPKCLAPHAKHAHITNQIGVAWEYRGVNGADQHILAMGKKHNRGGGAKDSSYDWDKWGNV